MLWKAKFSKGYARGVVDKTLLIRKHESDVILVQVYIDDIIFGSNNKYMCEAFVGRIWNVFYRWVNLLSRATSQTTQVRNIFKLVKILFWSTEKVWIGEL